MINKAKEAILRGLMAMDDVEDVHILTMAYQTLVNAEVQEKMAEWQTRDCPQRRDGLDDEVIG